MDFKDLKISIDRVFENREKMIIFAPLNDEII
jgi:hypothetical protein